MTNLSITTCVAALNRAALNRKAALQTEIAVGLAVFITVHGEPKLALREVYASAGYQCLYTSDIDYKTVNRRINTIADLFRVLTVTKLRRWVGKHNEDDMIRALEIGLEPYELYGVRDIERLCAPTTTRVRAHTRNIAVPPAPQLLVGPTTGQESVVAMFRRAADKVAKGARHIETEHLALMIPEDVRRDEIIDLARKLLELADELLLTH